MPELQINLYLCGERINRYSIATLINALRQKNLLNLLSVKFVGLAEVLTTLSTGINSRSSLNILAFSFMTCQWHTIKSVLQQIIPYKKTKNLLLIAGGPHPSGNPDECLKSGFDVIFIGEAELSFPQFIQNILQKSDWRLTPGIAYLAEEKLWFTSPPSPIPLDLSSTTVPEYNLIGDIEITRGCFFQCSYCQTPRIFRGEVRHRSINSILAEAGRIPKFIRFISPNALSYGASKPREINERTLIEMLTHLRNRYPETQINFGIFPSEVRPDYVTPGIIRQLKSLINNKYITIGVQSASDRMLRIINREHTVADVERAIETLLAEGFKVLLDFIFGLPGEDEQIIKENISFLKKWLSPAVRMRLHLFAPLPGTPLASYPAGTLHPALKELLDKYASQKIVVP